MSYSEAWNEPFLPWVESENDRRFKRILIISIILFSILGAIMFILPKPELEQKELKDVSPRLAKLIIEKKKQPPPPKPKVKKKAEKKKPSKKKKAEKKKPSKKTQKARKKAEKVGLVAMSDDLADLRESFDLSSVQNNNLQQKVGKTADTKTANSAVLTAKASKSSGGINTSSLSRNTGGSDLSGRSTTSVKSNIPSKSASSSSRKGKSGSTGRSQEEIELVFQKNYSAIDSLYRRALRKDPTLEGKIVIELTIAPSGKVTKARIISSELNNPALEKRLISRIKLLRFKSKNVPTITVNKPLDFLPS